MLTQHRERISGAARRGYTLLELVIALSIFAVLAAIAVPGYQTTVRKSRRVDAIARLTELQQAQERWRNEHATYGSLTDTRVPPLNADATYRMTLTRASASSYTAEATAIGAQAADVACRVLRVSVQGSQTTQSSGPDSRAANDAAENRRCWGR